MIAIAPNTSIRDTTGYKDAVKEVYYWQYGESTCFSAQLVNLLAKADMWNFAKLGNAYPELALAFRDWQQSETGDSFFKEHGLMV